MARYEKDRRNVMAKEERLRAILFEGVRLALEGDDPALHQWAIQADATLQATTSGSQKVVTGVDSRAGNPT